MIVGVGIDVVDVARFERTLERTPGLRTRLFVEAERGLAPRSLAARFAAKEALAKALGAPPGLRWTDAEVRTAADGCPSLHVSGTVEAEGRKRGVTHWHVSLSHDGGMATAIVVAERV
ncbi:MAG TPA: holo-ACP synthase [Streptosporangiaceae bacterium]